MRKMWLLLVLATTFGLAGGTTANASAWHHGSFPKAVRGYWHMYMGKGTSALAMQYHYTKSVQDTDMYGKVNGRWKNGPFNPSNSYNGSIRYKVIGHHKYYFKATKKENNKWYLGADRMVLTRRGHHKLTMKLHFKEGQHKWLKLTYYAGRVK
ncbi:hypothetical protein [Levilactobacillus yiduensis]|uniref:hypothetical protein n=1 Tax=Levilactobacillus yiduensis TaxID=2953880 RepID=UPI000EF2C491|nr:hypothetical protein [Levilactobacillus yiduensis]AYM02669.1 hypothetical protein D8911_06525 [Levilactobacillus brevis]